MALRPCPDCGEWIARTAKCCPCCGGDPRPQCPDCHSSEQMTPDASPIGQSLWEGGQPRWVCLACGRKYVWPR